MKNAILRLAGGRHRIGTAAFQAVLAAILGCVPAVAQFAYVPNGVDRTVSVINTATNTVTATITLGAGTLFPVGVAVNPSGTRVYVTNACDSDFLLGTGCALGDPGSVSVINAGTNTVITNISIPNEPVGVAVSQDGSRVFVVNGCSDCATFTTSGSVSVIDTAAGSANENKVIATIPLSAFDFASTGIAVNQTGSRLYVANLLSTGGPGGSVSVINTSTNAITTIDLGANSAIGLVLNPKRPRLYVAGVEGLTVIDTTNNTVIKTIDTAGFIGLAIKPDGTRLYAAGLGLGGVAGIAVIDTTNDDLNVVATAPTDPFLPVGFTVRPDGSRVYVTSFEKSVGLCSDNGQSCTASDLTLCGDPLHATCNVSSTPDNKVLVVDTATNLISSPITVGTGPTAFGQFIAPGICTGANIWAYLVSGPAASAAGGTYDWFVRFEVHACEAATSLKAQGGTNGWASSKSVDSLSLGATSIKTNNKNQVITWTMASLSANQNATLTLKITGTIKPGTPSGTMLDLVSLWSLGYSTATGQKSASAGPVSVKVQ
jgi:YVTN family beta-propeller protein